MQIAGRRHLYKYFEGEPRDEHKRSHFDSPLADIAVPSPGISPALFLPGQSGRIYDRRKDARADVVELSHFEPDAGRGAVYGRPVSDPGRGLLADFGRAALDTCDNNGDGVAQAGHAGFNLFTC